LLNLLPHDAFPAVGIGRQIDCHPAHGFDVIVGYPEKSVMVSETTTQVRDNATDRPSFGSRERVAAIILAVAVATVVKAVRVVITTTILSRRQEDFSPTLT
jgi:hypothetical protein